MVDQKGRDVIMFINLHDEASCSILCPVSDETTVRQIIQPTTSLTI